MSFFERFRRSETSQGPSAPETGPTEAPNEQDLDQTAELDLGGTAGRSAAGAAAADRPSDGVDQPEADSADQPEAQTAGIAALGVSDEARTDEAPEAAAGTGAKRQRPRRARRRVLLGTAAATVLLLAGSGAVVASAHKTVEVDLDGETYTFSTFAGSVDGLLDEAGIDLGPHDSVVPGAEESLSDGSDVVVRTGSQITITADGEQNQVWTTALTADEALSQFLGDGRDVSLEASRSADGRTELELPLVTDGPVTIVADGDERTVEVDGSATLAQVLVRAEIELNGQDETVVTVAEDGSPVVTVIRHTTETRTRTRAIEHDTVQRETDDLYEGESRVVEEGSDGERTITVQDHLVDGEVVSTKRLANDVTTRAEDRVVEVGTAERPAPEPDPAPAQDSGGSDDSGDSGSSGDSGDSGSSGDSGNSGDSGDSGGDSGGDAGSGVWAALAECESGGDPTTNTGNGYYGLYQFSLPTWQAVGGSGLPSEASAAEQTQRAQTLQERSGWGQWPACAAQLGLL